MRRTWLDRIADYYRLRRALRGLRSDSSIGFKDVRAVLDMYRLVHACAGDISASIVEELDFPGMYGPECGTLAKLTLFYLTERAAVTPFQIVNAVARDPFYAHADAAALNRGLFETTVNLVYLLGPDCSQRFKSFYNDSVQREFKLQEGMNRWVRSEDGSVRKRAEAQAGVRNATTEETLKATRALVGEPPPYPNLKDRCRRLGEWWDFNYDAKYRGLSSWQHGDASRIIASQAFQQVYPEQAERPVFESLGQCAWAWDLVYHLVWELVKYSKQPEADRKELQLLNQSGHAALGYHLGKAVKKFQG